METNQTNNVSVPINDLLLFINKMSELINITERQQEAINSLTREVRDLSAEITSLRNPKPAWWQIWK